MTKKANLLRSRKTPFTEAGIGRVPPPRCGAPSSFQWQICADGNNYRGLCARCDVALNALVLDFVGHPEAKSLMRKYRSEKLGNVGKFVYVGHATSIRMVERYDPEVLKAQAEFVKAMAKPERKRACVRGGTETTRAKAYSVLDEIDNEMS